MIKVFLHSHKVRAVQHLIYFCVCVKRITLCNCLCSSSSCCFPASVIRILGNSEQKNSLQTIEQLMQYTVLEIQFRSVKHTTVLRIRKNLETFHSYPSDNKARTVCWCKQPTSNSFQTLQTVYTYSNCTTDQVLYCWEMF